MDALEKAAAEMWTVLCEGKRLRPSECLEGTRAAIVAFLNAWEPSMAAQTAGQGFDGMFRCLQRAARAEATALATTATPSPPAAPRTAPRPGR